MKTRTVMQRSMAKLALVALAVFCVPSAFAELTGKETIANTATVNYESAAGVTMDSVSSTVNITVTPVYSFVWANFTATRVVSSGGTIPASNPVSFEIVNTGNVSDRLANVATLEFNGDGNITEDLAIQICEGDGTLNNSSPDGQDLTCGAVSATVDIWASGVQSITANSGTTTPTIAIYSNNAGTADPTSSTNNETNFSVGDLVRVDTDTTDADCEITAISNDSHAVGTLSLDELTLDCDVAVSTANLVGERKEFQVTASQLDLPTDGSDTQENVFFHASVDDSQGTEYCTGADGAGTCTTDNSDADDFDLTTEITVAVVGPALSIVKYQSDGGAGGAASNCEVTGFTYGATTDYVGDTAGDDCSIADVPSGTTMQYLVRVTNASGKTDANSSPALCFDSSSTDNSAENDCADDATQVIVTDPISDFLTLNTTSVILDLNCDGDGADGAGETNSNGGETLGQDDGKLWNNSGTLTVYADGAGNDVGSDSSATPVGGTVSPNSTTCFAFTADVI